MNYFSALQNAIMNGHLYASKTIKLSVMTCVQTTNPAHQKDVTMTVKIVQLLATVLKIVTWSTNFARTFLKTPPAHCSETCCVKRTVVHVEHFYPLNTLLYYTIDTTLHDISIINSFVLYVYVVVYK